jgi:iron complex outermembrane receptor protein
MKILCALVVTTGLVSAQTQPPSQAAPLPQPAPAPIAQSVIVTGVAQPAPLDEADRDVGVLPLPVSERKLYDSWFDLLGLDAALDMHERAPGGFLADLSIRGATFGQTLVLLNGMRISDVQTGHFNLDLPIPLEMLTSIEVLKGSGSTLYGSDAIGGVVNVRTEPLETPDARFYTGFGNFGTNEQHLVTDFGGPRFSEELAAARDFSKGFAYDRDYRNLSLGSLSLLKSKLGATSVLLAYADRPYGADQFYGPYPSWERIKTWFTSVHQNLGNKTEANFAYRRHTDLFVLFRFAPQIYTNRHIEDTWQGSLRRHDNLPLHAVLTYGAEGLSESINSTNLGMHSRTRGSAYAIYDLRFAKRFSFSAGIREEVYGSRQVVTSPSASGAAWLSARFKLRASVSRAFRLPSFTDLYYSDPANLGNPNLKPESATSYEGGADAYFSKKLHAAATVFQRRDSNDIDYVKALSSTVWVATNFDKLHFTGVEVSADYTPIAGQTIGVAFTALHGLSASSDVLISKYTFSYPVQSAVVQWHGAIGEHVIARTRIGVENRLAHYPLTIWDASAGYATGRVRPYLQLTNLTNADYQQIPAVPMPSRGILGGVELVLAGLRRP